LYQTTKQFNVGAALSVTFGAIQAGRTNWFKSRTANMAVWPLLCAIMLAKRRPLGRPRYQLKFPACCTGVFAFCRSGFAGFKNNF
jgi:hypothetical protein